MILKNSLIWAIEVLEKTKFKKHKKFSNINTNTNINLNLIGPLQSNK